MLKFARSTATAEKKLANKQKTGDSSTREYWRLDLEGGGKEDDHHCRVIMLFSRETEREKDRERERELPNLVAKRKQPE